MNCLRAVNSTQVTLFMRRPAVKSSVKSDLKPRRLVPQDTTQTETRTQATRTPSTSTASSAEDSRHEKARLAEYGFGSLPADGATVMSGAAASPSVRGPSQPTGSSSAAAPKQLLDTAYNHALVATRSRSPADGGPNTRLFTKLTPYVPTPPNLTLQPRHRSDENLHPTSLQHAKVLHPA